MDFSVRDAEKAKVVGLSGEIDLHHSPGLKEKLAEVAKQKPARVIVNFAQVTYIDSSGLATLIDLYQKMKGYGGKLGLAELRASVKNVFEVARLNQVFAIYETEQKAVDELK